MKHPRRELLSVLAVRFVEILESRFGQTTSRSRRERTGVLPDELCVSVVERAGVVVGRPAIFGAKLVNLSVRRGLPAVGRVEFLR